MCATAGDIKTSISTMLASKQFTDAQLAEVLSEMAELKRIAVRASATGNATSQEMQVLIQSSTSRLSRQLEESEQKEVLQNLYELRERLFGAQTDFQFSEMFKLSFKDADVKLDDIQTGIQGVREDMAEMRHLVQRELHETRHLIQQGGSGAQTPARRPSDSVRGVDKKSVSGTFRYIRKITSTEQGGEVPIEKFQRAFEALFLDGQQLSAEQTDELRSRTNTDASRNGGVSEEEYVCFFQAWLASGTDRVREWVTASSPTPSNRKAVSRRQSSLSDTEPEQWTNNHVADFVREMGDAYAPCVRNPKRSPLSFPIAQ